MPRAQLRSPTTCTWYATNIVAPARLTKTCDEGPIKIAGDRPCRTAVSHARSRHRRHGLCARLRTARPRSRRPPSAFICSRPHPAGGLRVPRVRQAHHGDCARGDGTLARDDRATTHARRARHRCAWTSSATRERSPHVVRRVARCRTCAEALRCRSRRMRHGPRARTARRAAPSARRAVSGTSDPARRAPSRCPAPG